MSVTISTKTCPILFITVSVNRRTGGWVWIASRVQAGPAAMPLRHEYSEPEQQQLLSVLRSDGTLGTDRNVRLPAGGGVPGQVNLYCESAERNGDTVELRFRHMGYFIDRRRLIEA